MGKRFRRFFVVLRSERVALTLRSWCPCSKLHPHEFVGGFDLLAIACSCGLQVTRPVRGAGFESQRRLGAIETPWRWLSEILRSN